MSDLKKSNFLENDSFGNSYCSNQNSNIFDDVELYIGTKMYVFWLHEFGFDFISMKKKNEIDRLDPKF